MCFSCCGERDETEPIIKDWVDADDIRKNIRYRITYYNPYNSMPIKENEYYSLNDVADKLKISKYTAERMCRKHNISGNVRIEKIFKNK